MLSTLFLTFFVMVLIISLTAGQKKAKTYCLELFPVRPNFHGIIGGIQTQEAEFPHMAALGYEDKNNPKWLCGGTLISLQFVLTAGHCAETRSGPVIKVRLGTRILSNPSVGYEDVDIKDIIIHPGFKPPSHYNDIALLQLAQKIIFSKQIMPACLHTSTSLTSKQLIAIGWGKTDFAGSTSDDLLKVSLKIVARNACTNFFKSIRKQKLQRGIDNKLQICAGSDSNIKKDTCQGDSGGPLGYKQGKKHYIGGITSFGKACGLKGVPAVYTRVSAYVPWIESIVWR